MKPSETRKKCPYVERDISWMYFYQSLCDQLSLSYALGTNPDALLTPNALEDGAPMLAPDIVPALPPGVLAPPFWNAKIGLSPAFFMSSTALCCKIIV